MHTPLSGPTRLALSTALGLLTAAALAPTAHASEEPGLDQSIEEGQQVATDRVERDTGHIDLGPRYTDGAWSLMVHDDTDRAGSVWRSLDDTVFRVRDSALRAVPDDPAYAFLGAEAGEEVHVVPQTQDRDVVWLGWNTQDPEVMETVDRGVTLSLLDVEGPGELVVYLQDGGFGEPDVLWDSTQLSGQPAGQTLWVDVNTHTHANWVFTEPGVHLVSMEATATLVDGSEVSAVGTARFAVGEDVTTAEALAAAAPSPPSSPTTSDTEDESVPAELDEGSSLLLGAGAVGGAGLLLAVVLVLRSVRGRNARRRALEQS